jgi:thiol-disulfide isomerase/thioredoxin
MIVHFALIIALAVAGAVPLLEPMPVLAQDAPAECASAIWLDPLAADPEAHDALPTESTETAPTWLTVELVDACSGETFTLADFSGKTLFVETMATWCPPCRDQLVRITEAAAQIPEEERGEIVFVVLSSEIDLPREELAEYAAANGFPFIFAVMPVEMLQAMAEDLGQEIAVPPATPHLIIAPDGTIGEVHTGPASPEDLLALIAESAAPQEAADS